MKKKAVVILILLICVAFASSGIAYAEESAEDKLQNEIEDKLDSLDMSELEKWLNENGNNAFVSGSFVQCVKDIINGRYDNNAGGFFKAALSVLTSAVSDILPTLAAIFAIAVLYGIVGGMSSGFLKKSTTELIYFACFCAMVSIVLVKVAVVVKDASATIFSMQSLMNAAFPVLLTLLTALGAVSSSAVYKPLMSLLATAVTNIVAKAVLPLFIAATVIGVVGNLSKNLKLEKLKKFFKSTANYILAGVFGIFVSFLTIQGLTGAIADSVSVKTAKFALQSYVPLLGGYLSDGFDLVLAGLVLIKNSAGMVTVLLILAAIAVPVVQIAVLSLGLKLVSGLTEPVSDDRFSKMLYGVSDNLNILISMLVGVGFMFTVTVMLVVATCNVGVV